MVSKKLLLVEERGEGKHGLCRGLLHLLVNFASSGHVLVKHSLLVTLLDAQDRLEEMFHDPGLPRHLHRHVSMGSNGLELAAVNKKQKTTSFPPFLLKTLLSSTRRFRTTVQHWIDTIFGG